MYAVYGGHEASLGLAKKTQNGFVATGPRELQPRGIMGSHSGSWVELTWNGVGGRGWYIIQSMVAGYRLTRLNSETR